MENVEESSTSGGMSTLSEVMNIAAGRGYTAEFGVQENGLCVVGKEQTYQPADTHIDNFYRFEGVSNPDDMAILYLIHTSDGTKGTLVDAYGTYGDSRINDFIRAVEDIHKAKTGGSES